MTASMDGSPGDAADAREVILVAYDVLEAALAAPNVEDAIAAMRPELEVRSREDLIRVAMALVGESAFFMQSPADRVRMLGRLQMRRLEAMVAE
jgi:hypothetical protein